jgi:hypothetical protein
MNEMHNPDLLNKVINKNLFIKTVISVANLFSKIDVEKDLEKISSNYNAYYNNDFVIDFVYNSNKIE